MWLGTKEEYFRLYEVTANHLKSCFGDSIKVGGYASCGFGACDDDPDCVGFPETCTRREHWFIHFAHEFLAYISSEEHKAPLDFFSWHSYDQPEKAIRAANYCRRLLAKYGFDHVEDFLNEWNPTPDAVLRSTPLAASRALAMMLGMQKTRVDMLMYYDARIGASQYGGMFNPDTYAPYLTYYAFMAFNELYKLKNEVFTESDDKDVYVGGASGGKRKCLLIANTSEEDKVIDLELRGVDPSDCEIVMLSDVYSYSPTGKTLKDNKLQLPSNSFAQIRFFD